MQGNAWQQISPTGTPPSVRELHTAGWSDAADGLYIFGGHASGVGWGPLADVEITRWFRVRGNLNDLWLFDRQAR